MFLFQTCRKTITVPAFGFILFLSFTHFSWIGSHSGSISNLFRWKICNLLDLWQADWQLWCLASNIEPFYTFNDLFSLHLDLSYPLSLTSAWVSLIHLTGSALSLHRFPQLTNPARFYYIIISFYFYSSRLNDFLFSPKRFLEWIKASFSPNMTR